MFDYAATIAAKRDGETLDRERIESLVAGLVAGDVSDAQMAAFAMAVCCRGMDASEVAALCSAMVASGVRLHWSVDAAVVDKHSTGGVGDKVSLVLAPLLAAAGLAVPMLSGRGLAHTGGTLDKLEAIPGFSVHRSVPELNRQLVDVGCFIAAATPDLVPADARLYALRDHTATVPSVSLIASSIMSKKIAGGASALVLDVKFGSGAFCATPADAFELASVMARLAGDCGLPFDAAVSPHSTPLGRSVGNGCEVAEALEVLSGAGPADTRELTLSLASRVASLAGAPRSVSELAALLASGAARERFDAMVAAQGGDPAAALVTPAHRVGLRAPRSGFVRFDAFAVAEASMLAGAGRERPGDPVDACAGVSDIVADGSFVDAGEVVAVLHGSDAALLPAAMARLGDALVCSDEVPPPPGPPVWLSDSAAAVGDTPSSFGGPR